MLRLPDQREVFYAALRDGLTGYAEREFSLARPEEDGTPYRTILQGLLDRARRSGNQARSAELEAELFGAPLPRGAEYLWRIFLRLHRRRGSTGFGPAPIGFGEIEAFCRLTGKRLSPWEVETIEMLDDLWRNGGTDE